MVYFQSAPIQHLLFLTTVALTLLIICAPTPSQAVPLLPGSSNFEYKHYCSNTLSDAIRLICGGRYNSLSRKFPESVGSGSFRTGALKRFAPDEGIFYRPILTGPIHECCRRPCGYSELKMYCAPD